MADKKTADSLRELAAQISTARKSKGISLSELARQAGVSTSTLNQLDKASFRNRLSARLLKKDTKAGKQWKRALISIANVLGEDPQIYLQVLARLGVEISEREIQSIQSDKWINTIEWFRRLHAERASKKKQTVEPLLPIALDTFLLTAGPTDHPQRQFYLALTRLILRTIQPSLEVKEYAGGQPESFQWMYKELRKPNPSFRIIVGLWKITTRESNFRFIPIPGWQHRLAMLTYESKLQWKHVFPGPNQRKNIRVLCIRREAGDLFLRGIAGLEGTETLLPPIEEHDMDVVAARFNKCLDSEKQGGDKHPVVLVMGEYEARTITHFMQSRYNKTVVDSSGGRAPRWPVSIAIAVADGRFGKLLHKAIREVFRAAPDLVAELYATYMSELLAESLAEWKDLAAKREFINDTFLSKEGVIPSYYEVSGFDAWIPAEFRQVLRKRLFERLWTEGHLVQEVLKEVKQRRQLINRMVPLQPVERIEIQLRQIKKMLTTS